MHNRNQLVILISAILFCVSCVTTRVVMYESISRPPKLSDTPIDIYESANLSKPYKVIAVVQANPGKLHNVADTLEYLKAKARKIGGDALLDLTQGPQPSGVIMPAGKSLVYGNVREIWSAKVIVWEER